MRPDVSLATDLSRALELAEEMQTVAARHEPDGIGSSLGEGAGMVSLRIVAGEVGITAFGPVGRAMADSRRHFADAATAVGVRVALAADGTREADL